LRQNHGPGGPDGRKIVRPGVATGANAVEIGLEQRMKGEDHGLGEFDDGLPCNL
jgi:hypothetical protein